MGVSSVIVVALLGLLSLYAKGIVCIDTRCFEKPDFLTVNLLQERPERLSEIVLPDHETRTVSRLQQPTAKQQSGETERTEPVAQRKDGKEPLGSNSGARDWHAMAKVSARQNIEDRFNQEAVRKSLWQKTRSVMFKGTGEFDFHEPATVIANREFRVPVGVLGIGVTIGGCFFGIPLAGIPLERRTTGPTLIYCPDIYE